MFIILNYYQVARVPDVGELMLAAIVDPINFNPNTWYEKKGKIKKREK